MTKAHYVVSLVLDPRYTKVALSVDYASKNDVRTFPTSIEMSRRIWMLYVVGFRAFMRSCMVTAPLNMLNTQK